MWFFEFEKPEMQRWKVAKNSLNFDEIRNHECHASTQHYLETDETRISYSDKYLKKLSSNFLKVHLAVEFVG